jgi:hypothetical protein
MAQLHGNSKMGVVGDDEEEEKDMWRAHFQQWVAKVELMTTTYDGDEDEDKDDDGGGDDDENDVDSDNNDDNDNED